MSTFVNFSSLQSLSTVGSQDKLLVNLNGLSGVSGFGVSTVLAFEKSLGVYSTVQANSAAWAMDSTTDTGVRSLTANWQNTYTNFSTQSANNISTYSTVNSQSARNASVYSTVQTYSAAWTDTAAPTTLTYAASITPSLSDGISRKVTMTGDLTLNAPTNATDGSLWKGRFTASGADRTITLGANILTPRGTTFSGIVSSGFTRLFEMNYNGTKWWLVRNQEFAP